MGTAESDQSPGSCASPGDEKQSALPAHAGAEVRWTAHRPPWASTDQAPLQSCTCPGLFILVRTLSLRPEPALTVCVLPSASDGCAESVSCCSCVRWNWTSCGGTWRAWEGSWPRGGVRSCICGSLGSMPANTRTGTTSRPTTPSTDPWWATGCSDAAPSAVNVQNSGDCAWGAME